MFCTVITFVLCTLSGFGIFFLYEKVFLCAEKDFNWAIPPHITLAVKDCEETVEFNIRSYIKSLKTANPLLVDIYAVDLGSKDDTFLILKKLEKEYDCLHILRKDEIIKTPENYL